MFRVLGCRSCLFLSSAFLLFFLVGCGSRANSSSGVTPPSRGADTVAERSTPRANHEMTIVEDLEEVSREILKPETKKPPECEQPTDAEIKSWSLPKRQPLELLSIQPVPRGGPVIAHPDGLTFVHAGQRVARWKIGAKEPLQIYRDPNTPADCQTTAIAISAAGDRLVTGDSDGTIRLWDTDSGQLLERERLSKHPPRILAVAISPNSRKIAVLGETASVVVLDASTLQAKATLSNDRSGKSGLFFMDDELLVVMGEGTEVWNTQTESRLDRFASKPLELAAPIGPDRKFFHYLTYDGLKQWSTDETSPECQIPMDGHTPSSLLYSHDGTLLALAGSRVEILDVSLNKRFQLFDTSRLAGICWTPKANLLVTSSSSGLIRILGTQESGSSFGLAPIRRGHIALPQDSSIPPTRNQLAEIIDLRTLPKPPRAQPTTDYHYTLYYMTPATVQEVRTFYRYFLPQHGWTEVATEQLGLTDTVAEFRKSGYGLYLQAFASSRSSRDQPHTTVYLTLSDYFDMHSLQLDGTPSWELEEERPNFLRYRATESLLEIELKLLRMASKTGWINFDDQRISPGDPRKTTNVRHLQFLRNGCELDVSVRPNSANPGSMDVTIICKPGRITSPPPDCTGLQVSVGDSITAKSKRGVSALRDHYDSKMRADGWRVLELSTDDDVQRVMYVDGLRDVTLSFIALEEGGSLVSRVPERKIFTPPVIEMADIPIEGPVGSVEYRFAEGIEFVSDKTWPELRDIYTDFLAHRDFKSGYTPKEMKTLQFRNGPSRIAIEFATIDEGISVRISGSGLRAFKPFPTDTPVVMSYSNWLRTKGHDISLGFLDEFESEMRAIARNSATPAD